MTQVESEIMSEHFLYLKELMDEKKLVLAGPVTSGEFGVVIFEAEDESEANSIMQNDPAVIKNVVSPTLYPFRISLLRN